MIKPRTRYLVSAAVLILAGCGPNFAENPAEKRIQAGVSKLPGFTTDWKLSITTGIQSNKDDTREHVVIHINNSPTNIYYYGNVKYDKVLPEKLAQTAPSAVEIYKEALADPQALEFFANLTQQKYDSALEREPIDPKDIKREKKDGWTLYSIGNNPVLAIDNRWGRLEPRLQISTIMLHQGSMPAEWGRVALVLKSASRDFAALSRAKPEITPVLK